MEDPIEEERKMMDDRRYDRILTTAYLLALGVTALSRLLQGDLPWMAFALLAMAFTVGAYRIFSQGILRLPSVLYLGVLLFLVMQLLVGELLRAFYTVPGWDKSIHLLSGVLLPFIGYRVYLRIREGEGGRLVALLFALMFGIFLATAWELLEFTTDSFAGTMSQQDSLKDTMVDLAFGSIGTLLTTVLLHIHLFRRPVRIFTRVEEEAARLPLPVGGEDEEGIGK